MYRYDLIKGFAILFIGSYVRECKDSAAQNVCSVSLISVFSGLLRSGVGGSEGEGHLHPLQALVGREGLGADLGNFVLLEAPETRNKIYQKVPSRVVCVRVGNQGLGTNTRQGREGTLIVFGMFKFKLQTLIVFLYNFVRHTI